MRVSSRNKMAFNVVWYMSILTSLIQWTESAECRSMTQGGQSVFVLDVCFQGYVTANDIGLVSQKLYCNPNKDGIIQTIYSNTDCTGQVLSENPDLFNASLWGLDCDSKICESETYAEFSLYLGSCDTNDAGAYANFGFVTNKCILREDWLDETDFQFSLNTVSVYVSCALGQNGINFIGYDEIDCKGNIVETLPLYDCDINDPDNDNIDYVQRCPLTITPTTATPSISPTVYTLTPSNTPTTVTNAPTTANPTADTNSPSKTPTEIPTASPIEVEKSNVNRPNAIVCILLAALMTYFV